MKAKTKLSLIILFVLFFYNSVFCTGDFLRNSYGSLAGSVKKVIKPDNTIAWDTDIPTFYGTIVESGNTNVYRSNIEFPISSVPSGSYPVKVEFEYNGNSSVNFYIGIVAGFTYNLPIDQQWNLSDNASNFVQATGPNGNYKRVELPAVLSILQSSSPTNIFLGCKAINDNPGSGRCNLSDFRLIITYEERINIIVDNNFTDNTIYGTHGTMNIDGSTQLIAATGNTITRATGSNHNVTLNAALGQYNSQGYSMIWNTTDCEKSKWTKNNFRISDNQSYTFSLVSDDAGKRFMANYYPSHATTTGPLATDETWISNVNLSGDVIVPSGRTLTISSCGSANLNGHSIISDGGTIINQGSLSGLRATALSGSSIKALCPTVQAACSYAGTNNTVQIANGTFTENIDLNGKSNLTITGNGTINGSMTLYNCPNLYLNSFYCNRIYANNCDGANIFNSVSGSSSETGIGLYYCSSLQQCGIVTNNSCGLLAYSSDVSNFNSTFLYNNTCISSQAGSDITAVNSYFCETSNKHLSAVSSGYLMAENCYYDNGTPQIYEAYGGNVDVWGNTNNCPQFKRNTVSNFDNSSLPALKIESDDPEVTDFSKCNFSYLTLLRNLKEDSRNNGTFTKEKFHDDFIKINNSFENFIYKYPKSTFAKAALNIITNNFLRFDDYAVLKVFLDKIISESQSTGLSNHAERLMVEYYRHQKDYNTALKKSDELILKFKDDNDLLCDALYAKGLLLNYELKQPDKALDCFKTIVNNYSENSLAEFAANQINVLGYEVQKEEKEVNIIDKSKLNISNHPNPFNPSTTIKYNIPQEGMVTIRVYDILGREVAKLVDEFKPAGSYNVLWNGKDGSGTEVSSGVYFYNIRYNDNIITKKMMLIR